MMTTPSDARGPSSEGGGSWTALAIARRAKEALADQTGLRSEKVVSVAHDDTGWHLSIDVVELSRIPPASDVLATYEVDLDEQGDIVGYRRAHRYVRGQVGEAVAP